MINLFNVGVHIGMTTNATQVLSTMLSHLTGVHVAAGKVQGALGSIRTAALGAGAVFAGWEVVKGLLDATKHAEKLNHALVNLQTSAQLSDAQTDDVKNLAFKMSRQIPGTAVDENVNQIKELHAVFRDMKEAKELAPMVAQGSRVVSNFTDKDTDLASVAVRALEIRGQISADGHVDPEMFRKEFNSLVRSIQASGNLVNQNKLLLYTQQAGAAARGMDADQFWGMSPAIMNGLGASKAGTALSSFMSQFVGHVLAGKRVAVAMEQAHMLTPGKWHNEKGGKVRLDDDAVPDQEYAVTHPFTWIHDKIEALRHQKDKHGHTPDLVGIIQKLFQLNSRVTSQRLMSDVDANWPIISKEENAYKAMPNPDVTAKQQNDKDLSVNIHNLHEAWTNFMAALGGPGIPVAIAVLHKLTDALNVMQEAIIKHPTITADLFYLAGGIGALTALGGAWFLVAGAWSPLVGGLKLLTGVTGLTTTGTAVGAIGTALGGLASALVPFAVGAAAAVALDLLIGKLHDIAGFGSKDGFVPLQGGPAQGVAPNPGAGYTKRPAGVAPMPGDDDFRVSPYVAPPATASAGKQSLILEVDGKKFASIMLDYGANSLSRPPTGRMGADVRVSPLMPGLSSVG